MSNGLSKGMSEGMSQGMPKGIPKVHLMVSNLMAFQWLKSQIGTKKMIAFILILGDP